MFNEKKLVLVLAVVLWAAGSAPALGQTINFLTIDSAIENEGAHTTISAILDFPGSETLTFMFFEEPLNLKTEASFPGFSCSEEKRPYGMDLVCDITGATRENKTAKLEFDTAGLIKQTGEGRLFEQTVPIPAKTSNFLYKMFLPEGSALLKGNSYLPPDAEKSSDGRRVMLFWRRKSLGAGESFGVKVSYEALSSGLSLEVLAVLFLAMGGLAFYFVRKRQPVTMQYLMPVLKEDEKIVMESVLKNGDGANQKVVVRESGYSKAKVSKVLNSLAERKLIRLERVGRNNRIFITKDVSKIELPEQAEKNENSSKLTGDSKNPEQKFQKVVKPTDSSETSNNKL